MISARTVRGFSLVELSIVLVILGLLTGGILAGQSLIRAAELRSVTLEFNKYLAATHAFNDKYFALPGDMNNATRIWSRQVNAAHCVTNSSAAVTTPGTCDGNGDGVIANAAAASESGEIHQYWRQLAHAGLIEGSYTGIAGTGSAAHCIIGVGCAAGKILNSGWGISNDDCLGNTERYAICMGNYFSYGGQHATGSPIMPILRPEEAWNIDTKMDDGKPAQGRVIARYWNNLCAVADDGSSAANDLNASYKLSDKTLQCALNFRQLP